MDHHIVIQVDTQAAYYMCSMLPRKGVHVFNKLCTIKIVLYK
jgi:hypothetical protein